MGSIISDRHAQDLAYQGLRAWHNEAINYPENYDLSLDQLAALVQKTSPDFFTNFGKSYALAQQMYSDGEIDKSLAALADRAEGRVSLYPDGSFRGQPFYDALIGRVTNWDWTAIRDFTLDTAHKGLEKVASAGTTFLGLSAGLSVAVALVGLYVVITSYKKA